MENLFKSAEGNARCGACMQTFKVFDHLKDYGASAGGLLVNPELARARQAKLEQAKNSGNPTHAERERADGRVEPVVLGDDLGIGNGALAANLDLDPIEMGASDTALQARMANWIPTLLGILMAAALAWLMWLQWFEVEAGDLPDNPLLQAAHKTACALVRCGGNPGQIVSRQLVVYSHPDREEALLVETVIVNLDQRERDFPILKLQFQDLEGNTVASRSFEPAEYLSGELAGKRRMAPQTPVQLALEIVDPGAQAVNYSLELLPAH